MNPEQFIWWLHGFAELNPQPPTTEQWKVITDHLDLMFKKVTPPLETPSVSREVLQEILKPQRERPLRTRFSSLETTRLC